MSRKPDYRIRALNKVTEAQGDLGAAWINPGGYITIVFNPFVTVPNDKDVVINLFPNDGKQAKPKKTEEKFDENYDNERIPF